MIHNRTSHVLAAVLTLAYCTASAHAQTGVSLRLLPWHEDQTADLKHATTFFEDGSVEDPAGSGGIDIQLTRHDTKGRFRIDQANPMSLSFGFESHVIDIHGPVGDSFGQLVDQSATVGFEVGQWRDIHVQGYGGLGYAGNEPYTDSDNLYGLAGLIFHKPLNETWDGLLVISYDGNRTIFPDIPLPAVSAIYKGREDMQLMIGFPVSRLAWMPDENWKIELNYALLYSGSARLGYTFAEDFELFALAMTSSEAFDDEDDFGTGADDRRLFLQQKSLEVGLVWNPAPQASFTLAAGYAFDQELSTGWDVRDLENEAELSDEPFVRMAAALRF